ncbi:DUF2793 domain-containing protein [Pseudochelatococcus sp. G4_1912]|uniref:DUF2793 domain-containing protein n=1 Tax=Pseudochelatococcus sp. G4_1912 TaxID=3114288 RepID=UPI0039C5FB22
MSETTKLRLPFLAAAQAQKHVTHNEALLKLDALVHLEVLDRDLSVPPSSPLEGDRYIVAAGASGAWDGESGHIAAWQDGAWHFYEPQIGWLSFVRDEGTLYVRVSGGWAAVSGGGSGGGGPLQDVTLFGLGMEADALNPFSAKTENVLWTTKTVSEGGSGDLRYSFNKEALANVLSLLFHRNFSGRVEVGLIGDDDFQIKVSSDGATWHEAMRVDGATGRTTFAQGIAPLPWVDVTDASTIVINAASGDKFRVASSGTRAVAKPTNLVDGMRFLLRITNSAAITLTLNSAFEPLSGTAPTLRLASGQMNTFDCIYDAAADKVFYTWY